jgi:hypothetical protein
MFAPGGTVYCATKAAVRALTEGLRMELHSQNIRYTMISPGAIATELAESSSGEATRKNLREFMKMAIPAGAIARAIDADGTGDPLKLLTDHTVRPSGQDEQKKRRGQNTGPACLESNSCFRTRTLQPMRWCVHCWRTRPEDC